MKLRTILLAVLLAVIHAAPARAHFLFVRILPAAEGGRFAEVYFSELAEAGDARFIAKIAHTGLWRQAMPGKFEPLTVRTAHDRLRAHLPTAGSVGVIGVCDYGVLARPKQPAFLLRHFPKAVAGEPKDVNALRAFDKAALEIVPTFLDGQVRLLALRDGKPLPGVELQAIDATLTETKLKADAKGEATFKPAHPGVWSVYMGNTRKEAGEFGKKKYDEIREFATLSFTWPLVRKDADAQAVTLFEEALAARAAWDRFTGFEARIQGNLAGRPFTGSIVVDADGSVTFTDDDPSRQESVSGWVVDQLSSIAMHRRARSGDGKKPVLRLAEGKAEDPLGRLLIFEGGAMASSYRVKDKQIAVVNRHLGKENMTITILDNDKNAEGRFLPRSYTVQYWDAATGRLLRAEAIQDQWQRVGAWDLPAFHQVIETSDAGVYVRAFTLSKHEVSKR